VGSLAGIVVVDGGFVGFIYWRGFRGDKGLSPNSSSAMMKDV